MAASANDKFLYVGNPGTATTLSAPGYTIGNTSITVGSTANFPTATGVIFAIDTAEIVDGEEVQVNGTYCVFSGTVTDGTTISNMTLEYGTPQNYASGALTRVYIPISALHTERLIEGLLAEHDQLDGTHTNITPTSVTTPTATITNATITNLTVGSQAPSADWTTIGTTPTTVTYNGQRSYSVLYPGIDLTNVIQPGTRLRTTRTVAAPTQCASLNGTNQYFNDTTVSGMTFTDDFVVGAWVKLNNYPSSDAAIISRYNGTSGWHLVVASDGRLFLNANNAGAGNVSLVGSYQSLPLNKWVHVAAQLDMSAFTATTTTSYIMIDGVDVPALVQRAGTNPTALVQAGNLEIGSRNASNFFPGKIAQAFVSSAKITQANVRTLISQGLTSALVTSNNIISAYSLSNSLTDINTTNANNLTAQNSATTTNADSPFGTQASGLISSTLDYGIIQSVSFSTDTAVVVQVPEGCTIPTSGGVSASAYSGLKTPYGFPAEKFKWAVEALYRVQLQRTVVSTSAWLNITGVSFTLPIGKFDTEAKFGGIITGTSASFLSGRYTISNANNTQSNIELTCSLPVLGSALNQLNAEMYIMGSMENTAQTTYFVNGQPAILSGTTVLYVDSTFASVPAVFRFTNAYL